MSCHTVTPARCHYRTAMATLARHGFTSTLTQDGLVGFMPAVWNDPSCPGFSDGDTFMVEPHVFAVEESDGTVDRRAVRAWLGY